MKKDVHSDNEVGHPWFYGYNNSATLPPSTPFAIASRFGYRGASALTKQVRKAPRVALMRFVRPWGNPANLPPPNRLPSAVHG